MYAVTTLSVGSLSKIIVIRCIEAQLFSYELLMMHILMLEWVPLSNFNIHADKQNGCLAYANYYIESIKLMLVTNFVPIINYLANDISMIKFIVRIQWNCTKSSCYKNLDRLIALSIT